MANMANTEIPNFLDEEKFRLMEAEIGAELLITRLQKLTGRSCDNCSLCCKVLRIESTEFEKPANKWCSNCQPGKTGSCGIYQTRPRVCRDFACVWLINNSLPDYFFPAKSKMIFTAPDLEKTALRKIELWVDAGFKGRWRQEPYWSFLEDQTEKALKAGDSYLTIYDNSEEFIVMGKRIIRTANRPYSMWSPDGRGTWFCKLFGTTERKENDTPEEIKAREDEINEVISNLKIMMLEGQSIDKIYEYMNANEMY